MRPCKQTLAGLAYPVRIRMPAVYATDWIERCNGQRFSDELGNTEAVIVERRSRDLVVEVNRAGLEDVISDVDYYTSPGTVEEIWNEYRGIVMSARAAKRRLLELGYAT